MTQLNNEDLEKTNALISKLNVAVHVKEKGIERLIDKWNKFVSESKQGYSLTSDDYCNELSIRNILQEIIEKLDDGHIIKKIKDSIDNSDKFFKDLLVDTDRCVWPADKEHKDWFWIWGVVKNAKEELKEDLKNEGWPYYNK